MNDKKTTFCGVDKIMRRTFNFTAHVILKDEILSYPTVDLNSHIAHD